MKSRSKLVALALIALLVPAGFAGYIAARAYRAERSEFVGQRHAVTPRAGETGVQGLADVSLPRRDGSMLRGWYAPSRNRAAIILTHGSSGDRSALLPEARTLAAAGFGVLLFDWPGHGESDGEVTWDEGERQALITAVDWLAERPDVDASRIGALGFSAGGYILAQVAPFERRIKAVVTTGTPADLLEHTNWAYRRWGALSRLPALWAIRRSGARLERQRPVEVFHGVAPRPVLVIGGADDPVVPTRMVEALYAAAAEPKELWLVPGAGHGGFAEASPREYPARIRGFFERSLSNAR
jgi:dipeptidyl aminopeptidase/acylaminoacyl peptidase